MPAELLWTAIFLASIAVLVFSSSRFITAAEAIGVAFNLPTFLIGVTIVAAGTSLPELVSSTIAVTQGSSEIVIGNVVGSNISNILLILGIVAIFSKTIRVDHDILNVDLPLFIGSALTLTLFVWDQHFSIFEAVLSLAGLIVYMWYALRSESSIVSVGEELEELKEEKQRVKPATWIWLIAAGGLIYISADYTVKSIIELSELLNIGGEVIALSAVSLGTSLPELSVSIVAARKGNSDMAVGNVLGSNIFNSFGVMAIPAFVGNLEIPDNILTFGLPMMVVASLLYFFISQNKTISRWEGMMLMVLYIYFIGQLFVLELG